MRSFNRGTWIAVGLVAIGVIADPGAMTAQSSQMIDRAEFFGHPEVTDVQVSPDGRLLAFRAPFEEQMHLWLTNVHVGLDSAVRVSGGPAEEFYWTRDSRYLLFLRDDNGDERYHLFAVAADSNASDVPRDLTPYDGVQARVYLLPDSTPEEVVVGLNDRDPSAHDVYRVQLATGDRQLVRENDAEFADWVVDKDGIPRLGVRIGPDGGTEILSISGDTLSPAFDCGPDEICKPLRFHRNNNRVYIVTNRGDRDLTGLVLFHPVTFEVVEVHSDPDGRVDFGEAIFSPDSDLLVATTYHDDTTRVYSTDSTFANDLDWLAGQVPFGSLSFESSNSNSSLWVLRVENDTEPGTFYLYNRWYDTIEPLGRVRPNIAADDLASSSWITYRSSDGENIRALLTLPTGDSLSGLPAVLIPHDGPIERTRWAFHSLAQFLANRGYVVLQPDYRGSLGYGKQHSSAGVRSWGIGVAQTDLADGARYLVDRGLADPERIGIVGIGYGGYAALAGLSFTPDLFSAGVAIGAITDLSSFVTSRRPVETFELPKWHYVLGNPDVPEDRARMESQSPLRFVDSISAPALIVAGTNNSRVSIDQSERFVHALRSTDKRVEYLRIQNEGQSIRNETSRLAIATVLERFLSEHLGGSAQGTVTLAVTTAIADMTVGDNDPLGPAVFALTAPLPSVDGSTPEPATLVYRVTTSDGSDMELTRQVEALTTNGRDVWRVIDSTLVPAMNAFEFDSTQFMDENFEFEPEMTGDMMPAADTIVVDRNSLLPIQRRTGGLTTVTIDYSPARVTGEFEVSGFVDVIDVPLEASVFGDGGGIDLAIGAMTLADGYETGLRVFDMQLGQVVPYTLSVVGTTQVDTEAGSFETYRIQLEPVGVRYAVPQVLFVRQESPHILIRSEMQVQNEFGSYEETRELISITPRSP